MGRRTLALVGNPNVGKTVLFNSLCGANERVGNWHGVTTQKKVCAIRSKGEIVDIVDLPGCYNISGNSLEEQETAKFLSEENCDVVNICDSRQLERNLYLTLLLLEHNYNVLLFFNSYTKKAPKIDIYKLKRLLGVEILSQTADKTQIDYLLAKNFCRCRPKYYDEKFINMPPEEQVKIRYQYIENLLKSCILQNSKTKFDLDKIFLGKFAFVIFAIMCLCLFYICFGSVGKFLTNVLQDFLQGKIIEPVNSFLSKKCSSVLTSFVCDGILSACFGLICFLPQIMLVSFFINILQDCGYLSRIAFLFDGLLSRIGLSGKAIFSLLISLGCNTTAILTTGGQENKIDKIRLSMFLPFICCSAKLPVFVIFTNLLFNSFGFLFTICLYIVSFAIGAIVMSIVTKFTPKSSNTFLLELGDYKFPNIKSAIKDCIVSAKNFLIKIGTIVFVANVIVWGLQTFDFSLRVNSGRSMLKQISSFLSPIFAPIGLNNYGVVSSLIVGILAKELIVTTLAVVNGISSSGLALCLGGGLVTNFSPLTLVVFLVFVSLYSPCISYLFAIKKSIGGKYAIISFVGMTFIAYIVCMIIYFFGSLFFYSIEFFIWSILGLVFALAVFLCFKIKSKCLFCSNKNCPKSQK